MSDFSAPRGSISADIFFLSNERLSRLCYNSSDFRSQVNTWEQRFEDVPKEEWSIPDILTHQMVDRLVDLGVWRRLWIRDDLTLPSVSPSDLLYLLGERNGRFP